MGTNHYLEIQVCILNRLVQKIRNECLIECVMSSSRFSVFFVLFPTLFERKYKFFVLSAAYSSNPKVTKMGGERKKDFFITDCANLLLHSSTYWIDNNGILSPKLFWPTVRKNCCRDREKLLKLCRGWRQKIWKIFEITRTIYSNSERSEQFLVTECFYLFLEVSQI